MGKVDLIRLDIFPIPTNCVNNAQNILYKLVYKIRDKGTVNQIKTAKEGPRSSVSSELNVWWSDAKLKRSNRKMICVTGIEKYLRQYGESVRFMFSRGEILK